MFFNSLTDGLPKKHVFQPYLDQSEVVKSVSCTKAGEDPGAL